MVQWLRLHTANAEGLGLIPGWGTKIPHAVGQLSLLAATTEPIALEPMRNEEPAHCNKDPVQPKFN